MSTLNKNNSNNVDIDKLIGDIYDERLKRIENVILVKGDDYVDELIVTFIREILESSSLLSDYIQNIIAKIFAKIVTLPDTKKSKLAVLTIIYNIVDISLSR